MKPFIKIELVPTKRTDVLCIACNGFRADSVFVTAARRSEVDYGLHKVCYGEMHVTRSGAGRAPDIEDGDAS